MKGNNVVILTGAISDLKIIETNTLFFPYTVSFVLCANTQALDVDVYYDKRPRLDHLDYGYGDLVQVLGTLQTGGRVCADSVTWLAKLPEL